MFEQFEEDLRLLTEKHKQEIEVLQGEAFLNSKEEILQIWQKFFLNEIDFFIVRVDETDLNLAYIYLKDVEWYINYQRPFLSEEQIELALIGENPLLKLYLDCIELISYQRYQQILDKAILAQSWVRENRNMVSMFRANQDIYIYRNQIYIF